MAHVQAEPSGLALSRLTLEQIATALQAKLTGENLDEKKSALRQIIYRILVTRDDHEIRALIEYHLPGESNIPPEDGGDISNHERAPGGDNSLLLIIPIKNKYIYKSDR